MLKELKKAIFEWLLENENEWQRVNACTKHFSSYMFDSQGNWLIGGERVAKFIKDADTLLYSN